MVSSVLANISYSLPPSARRLKGACSSSTFPASIRDISRMSLMRESRYPESSLALVRYCMAGCSGVSCLSASVSIPVMPFMGVRISWDIRNRKLVLNWLASSA